MQVIGGKVTKLELKTTKTGKEFLKFSVAETKGWGENKETVWYDCTTWDKSHDYTGAKVLVFGQVSQRTYQEKIYNDVEVFHVEVLDAATPSSIAKAQVAQAMPKTSASDASRSYAIPSPSAPRQVAKQDIRF